MKTRLSNIALLVGACLAMPLMASAASYPVEGYLTDADGNPLLTTSTVTLTFEVVDSADCVAYEETHSLSNLFGAGGYFNVMLGEGTRSGGEAKDTNTLETVMDTSTTAINGTRAASGCTFSRPGDQLRDVRISYTENGVTETLAETLKVAGVPFALNATKLGGMPPSNFLARPSTVTQTQFENVFDGGTRLAELNSLIDGNSSEYLTSAPSGPIDFNSQKIENVGAPLGANDATNKDYVDTNIGGTELDLGGLTSGKVLSYDGTKWVASDPASSAGDITSGGNTVATSLEIGTKNAHNLVLETDEIAAVTIDTTQGVSMSAGLGVTGGVNIGGSVGVGTMTPDASAIMDLSSLSQGFLIPRMTAGDRDAISSPAAGLQVYNLDTSKINVFDGLSWEDLGEVTPGLASLNGLTGTTQTFSTGTAGPDFSISSSADIHTFNLPTASGSNRGALSSADWTTFNNKLNKTLPAGEIFVGDGSGEATGVAMNGDAVMTNAGAVTVTRLRGFDLVDTPPTPGQVLKWNDVMSRWEPDADDGLSQADVTAHVGTLGYALEAEVLRRDGSSSLTGNLNLGGNSLVGSTGDDEDLILDSTSGSVKGSVILIPGGGRVGIEVAEPQRKLDVAAGGMRLRPTDIAQMNANGARGDLYIDNDGPGFLRWHNGSDWYASVPNSGDISAGQTVVESDENIELHVDHDDGGTGSFRVVTGSETTPALEIDEKTARFNGAVIGNHSVSSAAPLSGTFFFESKNTIYTDASCGAYTLRNMENGGSYSLIIRGASANTCDFTVDGFSEKYAAGHGPTSNDPSVHRIYSFMVVGDVAYITWVDFDDPT